MGKLRKLDEAHKNQYLEIMNWSDAQFGELSELGKTNSPQRVAAELDKLDRLIRVEIPEQRDIIVSKMCETSTYLSEKKYNKAFQVKERETAIEAMLKQVKEKALKVRGELSAKKR